MYSAHLAAAKGLPYVFAHHFSGKGTEEALEVYRSRFRPSALTPEPLTFLTVNAVVAETRDEATALMLPNLQMMAKLRTGQPLGPVPLVEEAEHAELTAEQRRIVDSGLVGRPGRGRRAGSGARRAVRCRRGDGESGGVGPPRDRPRHRAGPGRDAGAAGQGAVLTPGRTHPRDWLGSGAWLAIQARSSSGGSGGVCTKPWVMLQP